MFGLRLFEDSAIVVTLNWDRKWEVRNVIYGKIKN